MLVIKNLTLVMTKDLRVLLEDFNFSLQPGMKAGLIGEEGNGKSALLKAIADPASLRGYLEITGEIITAGEIIGYLPQVLPEQFLDCSTREYFVSRVNTTDFDYALYYRLLDEMSFPEDRISESIRMRQLSGGEKIKLQLLCAMLKEPTVLLLDEPSNDLDLESVKWLEGFIRRAKVPMIFVSHDELLLDRCANTIIHLEQLMRKRKPQYSIARLGYGEYVKNREDRITKQMRVAQKEKEEFAAKLERYRQIYQRVQHELRTVSRQDPSMGKNLKDKMHTVKALGKRLEREKGQLTKRPDYEESITVRFDTDITIPRGKVIVDLHKEPLQAGERILSRSVRLRITGPQKVCIVGANGAGKTTLLRCILQELAARGMNYGYMPQDYTEYMDPEQSAVEFLMRRGTKDEVTTIRTYLGSMNFTAQEMDHALAELSGGQRAKLYFSKMILDRAEILVLDEPTRNLSPLSGPEIRTALKAFGGCIIAVSHDRKFIGEVFDQVLLLDEEGLHPVVFSEELEDNQGKQK
ncbi:MAG: ABC-F family ATP-binding cassette domain-containing protein [Firmicutes bacterium]|nr:ABC-F family ATP-binding cassette domain-containing protein [Bacillota bacterium]